MPLIYNKILTHFSGLNSVALNANGDLAALCFNDRELLSITKSHFSIRYFAGSSCIERPLGPP